MALMYLPKNMGYLMVYLLFLMDFVNDVSLLENGLARTPPMGWMSWGYYMCADKCEEHPDKCLDEKLILTVADSFYKEGYQEAGFNYIVIDDCWSEKWRDSAGRLVPDQKRFPHGMKFLADYIHARGLKFGMYINIAKTTCMGFPGSKGHFNVDAETFAEWDVDYIKVDGCFVKEDYLDVAYIKLGHHLNQTGRPMVYSCSWPYYKKYINKHPLDYNKVLPVCNLWRNYHDVAPHWDSVVYIMRDYEENAHYYSQFHGPGHWNDPDMLILGTDVLTPGQARIQMVVYAMWSAPLLISCDMAKIKPYEKKLLQNMNLLAIAQDALGVMAVPYRMSSNVVLWVKPHHPMKGDMYHSYSFAVVNLGKSSEMVSLNLNRYLFNSTDLYTVLDVLSEKIIRNVTLDESIDVTVKKEDVVMYSLFPL